MTPPLSGQKILNKKGKKTISRRSALGLGLVILFSANGCSSQKWNKTLPSSAELGSPRGYRVTRNIIHLHSPYSFDGCDSRGVVDGVVDEACLQRLRSALCKDHIDFGFLTDHPSHMADYPFETLMLNRPGDTLVIKASQPVGNLMSGCEDGHTPLLTAGFENALMPISMENHLEAAGDDRNNLYTSDTATNADRFRNEAGAIVIVPHTEKWTVSDLSALNPDGIEIYNIHANADPKIRVKYLGFGYYEGTLNALPYWIDPYGQEQPDLAFVSFLRVSDVYAAKWDALLGAGKKVFGIGGSDSHENTIKSIASDDERIDSHRRMLRWLSNHFLVDDLSLDGIKDAIKKGRGWAVYEGLGSPVGMDFYAQAGATVVGVGETGSFVPGSTKIRVESPKLHAASPQGLASPKIIVRLRHVLTDGTSVVVASSVDTSLEYEATELGVYRAEVSIVPLHLAPYLNFDREKAWQETAWITTNPLYLQ